MVHWTPRLSLSIEINWLLSRECNWHSWRVVRTVLICLCSVSMTFKSKESTHNWYPISCEWLSGILDKSITSSFQVYCLLGKSRRRDLVEASRFFFWYIRFVTHCIYLLVCKGICFIPRQTNVQLRFYDIVIFILLFDKLHVKYTLSLKGFLILRAKYIHFILRDIWVRSTLEGHTESTNTKACRGYLELNLTY